MSRRYIGRYRSGAAAVEFAMTAPLVFMLLLGALELGHANMVFHAAEAAAFEGARAGIVPGATSAEVTSATQNVLDISRIRDASISISPSNLDSKEETIRVQVNVPYPKNTLMPPFFTKGLTIRRECRLSRELGAYRSGS